MPQPHNALGLQELAHGTAVVGAIAIVLTFSSLAWARKTAGLETTWDAWRDADVIASVEVVAREEVEGGALLLLHPTAIHRGPVADEVVCYATAQWLEEGAPLRAVAYLNAVPAESRLSALLQSYGDVGYTCSRSPSSMPVVSQESLQSAFALDVTAPAFGLPDPEARIAVLDWVSERHPDELSGRIDAMLGSAMNDAETKMLLLVVEVVLSTAESRATRLAPLLETLESHEAAEQFFRLVSGSSGASSSLVVQGLFDDRAHVRAAALRWVHRAQSYDGLSDYLDRTAAHDPDPAVQGALLRHLAITGDVNRLLAWWPDGPSEPAHYRLYLAGLARSGTEVGWAHLTLAADAPQVAHRIWAYHAIQVAAGLPSAQALDVAGWLLRRPLDDRIEVQALQVVAVAALEREARVRDRLADWATDVSVSPKLAYLAALALMSECNAEAVAPGSRVVATSPHPAVVNAVQQTLAAWVARGGPGCD